MAFLILPTVEVMDESILLNAVVIAVQIAFAIVVTVVLILFQAVLIKVEMEVMIVVTVVDIAFQIVEKNVLMAFHTVCVTV